MAVGEHPRADGFGGSGDDPWTLAAGILAAHLPPCGRCGHHYPDPDVRCDTPTADVEDGEPIEVPCGCPCWQPEEPPPCEVCRRTPLPGEDHARAVRLDADDDVELVCIGVDRRAIAPIVDPWASLAGPQEDPPF